MNPADLIQLLKQHILEITFTKVNGELRVMPCTLREDMLPLRELKENDDGTSRRPKPPNTISVYCTDKKEWRSFRFDNLKTWKILE